MISHSTKTKRRRNANFYAKVAKIQVVVIDNRHEQQHWLVSYPVNPKRSEHYEAYGRTKMLAAFRMMLRTVRRICWFEEQSKISDRLLQEWNIMMSSSTNSVMQ